MFQSLSDKLQATLGDLRSRGALSAEDIDRAMREIRLALLEADVNFQRRQGRSSPPCASARSGRRC